MARPRARRLPQRTLALLLWLAWLSVACAAAPLDPWTGKNRTALVEALARARPASLRLGFNYSGLAASGLSAAQAQAVQSWLGPAAIAVLAKFLQVRVPQAGALKAPLQAQATPKKCGFEFPRALTTTGVPNTDLLLVFKRKARCSATSYSSARACDWDPLTHRPTLGSVSLCPKFFDQPHDEQLATLLHEVTHALGFSGQWAPLFYDQATGQPYKQVLLNASSSEPGLPAFIVTPRVQAYARAYFGCPSLPGAPLDPAARLAHWAQDAIALDYMTPNSVRTAQPSRITPFTLKLLEDTGWYVANYSAAEEPEHGRGAGCAFVTTSCGAFLRAQPGGRSAEFCKLGDLHRDVCTPDARGIVECVLNTTHGCLAPGVHPAREATHPLLDCERPESFRAASAGHLVAVSSLGGAVAPGSRCVQLEQPACAGGGAGGSQQCTRQRQALCASAACNANGTALVLSFHRSAAAPGTRNASAPAAAGVKAGGGERGSVTCSAAGARVDLAHALPRLFASGVLACPDPAAVCPTLGCAACPAGRGTCWRGQCRCRFFRSGPSCAASLLPER